MKKMKFRFSIPCLVISGLATLASVGAIARTWFLNPTANRLARYDFSTPKAACFSLEEMNSDFLAQAQFAFKVEGPVLQEYLKTLEVKKEVESEGRRILFVSFSVNGVKKFKTEQLQKDAQTGFWFRTSIAKVTQKNITFTRIAREIGGTHGPDTLEKQIDRWENQGEL